MITSVLFFSSALLGAAPEGLDNIDFSRKTFSGWGGNGFTIGTIPFQGKTQLVVVTSKEAGATGATGVLYRTIRVPQGVSEIRVLACVAREPGQAADDRLDVAVLTEQKKVIAKEMANKSGDEWSPARRVQPPQDGQLREYRWKVDDRVGQLVQLLVVDEDDRPGSYVISGGFLLLTKLGDVHVEKPVAPPPAATPAPKPAAPKTEEIVRALISQLQYGSNSVRPRAAAALGQLGARASVAGPELIRALNDVEPAVRIAAARSLGQIGPNVPGAISALSRKVEEDLETPETRIAAAQALGAMGAGASAVAPQLVTVMRREGARGEAQAKAAAGPVPVPATGDLARRGMTPGIDFPDDSDVNKALDFLTRNTPMGPRLEKEMSKEAEQALEEASAIGSKQGTVAAAVRNALVRIGQPAVFFLLQSLGDPNVNVRMDAIGALGAIGPPAQAATPSLQQIARGTQGRPIRVAAWNALKRIDPAAVAGLQAP